MPFDQLSPAYLVLAVFLTAGVAPLVSRLAGAWTGVVLAVVPGAAFAVLLGGAGEIWGGEVWRASLPWAPVLGLNWDLWVSPTGLLLGLLVTGIGLFIVIYAGSYLKTATVKGRFFSYLFLFMGAMFGLAVTENLLVFFLFWELTSITSFLLIAHYEKELEGRRAAMDALLVTAGGGVFFLGGVILMGQVGGSYLIGELAEKRGEIVGHAQYPLIFGLVLLGAMTKSAQFPFHFWLPGAMAAPAPVSAYLHSATMVKAGVFLLALLSPVLGGTELWQGWLMGVGAVTMTWAALVAAVQTDLKRLLAFTTVSALGTLVLLLGIGTEMALKGAALFIVAHALYKGALFMVAGALEKATGVRETSQLGGLFRQLPVLGVAALLAAISMAGVIPMVGFLAKEVFYDAILAVPAAGALLVACGIIAGAANLVVACNVGVCPFFCGRGPELGIKAEAAGPGYWAGPVVLGVLGLVFGLVPKEALAGMVGAVAGQIRGEDMVVKLSLWHGFNLVLLLSAVTILVGVVLAGLRGRLWALGAGIKARLGWSGQAIFRGGLDRFLVLAGGFTRLTQSGRLHNYLMSILVAAIVLLAWAWVKSGYHVAIPEGGGFRFEILVVVLLIAASGLGLVLYERRMTAILSLGGVGFGISSLYALFGAPDLATTQLLVETLTLVLFALAIYGLPGVRAARPHRGKQIPVYLVAIGVGSIFTLLTLKTMDLQLFPAISAEMGQRSLVDAYGRNVVNVILVDFRALDTLGEITVLLIAALGVFAMLGREEVGASPRDLPSSPVLLASARYTAPAMMLFAIYLTLRGHNEPGGGFVGGLVAAMSIILSHLARPESVLRLMGMRPILLMAVGLILALLSGVYGLVVDAAYLDAWWGGSFTLPVLGKIKIGTPLAFDVGVFLVVAGVVLTLYGVMEQRQSQWRAGQARG
jgi:multicomponent Na+:H+ antiporter subunit A